MNNPSYKRLYMYALKLYGKSRPFPLLNLLAKQFLNTVLKEGSQKANIIAKNNLNKIYDKVGLLKFN